MGLWHWIEGWPSHWLVVIVIGLHNLEESIWLPGWLDSQGRKFAWRASPHQFRFTAGSLTLLLFILAAWLGCSGEGSVAHYLLAAYAIGQGLNVIVPHAALSLVTKHYMPGLASGVLLVIPTMVLYVGRWLATGHLAALPLALATALLIPLVLMSIPLLFWLADTSFIRRQL